jgi:hypothetical protein
MPWLAERRLIFSLAVHLILHKRAKRPRRAALRSGVVNAMM